jgi:uncharacterized protein YegL
VFQTDVQVRIVRREQASIERNTSLTRLDRELGFGPNVFVLSGTRPLAEVCEKIARIDTKTPNNPEIVEFSNIIAGMASNPETEV